MCVPVGVAPVSIDRNRCCAIPRTLITVRENVHVPAALFGIGRCPKLDTRVSLLMERVAQGTMPLGPQADQLVRRHQAFARPRMRTLQPAPWA